MTVLNSSNIVVDGLTLDKRKQQKIRIVGSETDSTRFVSDRYQSRRSEDLQRCFGQCSTNPGEMSTSAE